jgi:hypothetical protein
LRLFALERGTVDRSIGGLRFAHRIGKRGDLAGRARGKPQARDSDKDQPFTSG